MASAPAEVLSEAEQFKTSLRRWHRSHGRRLVAFERVVQTLGSHHAHVQTVGIPAAVAEGAAEVFSNEGKRIGVGFVRLSPGVSLGHAAGSDQYMLVEVDAGQDEGVGSQSSASLAPMQRLFYKV